MSKNFLAALSKVYRQRDLEALERFCEPVYREINRSNSYRSVLMLSCNNIKHLSKIETLPSEAIVLNLEDGVATKDKPYALVLSAIFLARHRVCSKKLIVRVNSLDTTGYDEITYLNRFMPDAIRIPKVRSIEEVDSVLALLDEQIELHLTIETKEAWHLMGRLKRDKRIKAYYLGILDLFADMGLSQDRITPENPTVRYMLPHFLTTCKSLDIKAVSFVYQEHKQLERFREWLELESAIGFDAKGCITPTQAEYINEIFCYDPKEVARAREIVREYELYGKESGGFVHKEYGFVDEPVYKAALRVLERISDRKSDRM